MKCVMKTYVTFKPGRVKILTFLHAGEVLVTNCLHRVIKMIYMILVTDHLGCLKDVQTG